MSDMIHAMDTNTGKVAVVPAIYLDIPPFRDYLVEVEPGTKDRTPNLHTPVSAPEFREQRKDSPKLNDKGEKGSLSDKPLDLEIK